MLGGIIGSRATKPLMVAPSHPLEVVSIMINTFYQITETKDRCQGKERAILFFSDTLFFRVTPSTLSEHSGSLVAGGDMHYHLSQHGVFSEKEMRFYASEIILGLEHMHTRFVVYRDLKVRRVGVCPQWGRYLWPIPIVMATSLPAKVLVEKFSY